MKDQVSHEGKDQTESIVAEDPGAIDLLEDLNWHRSKIAQPLQAQDEHAKSDQGCHQQDPLQLSNATQVNASQGSLDLRNRSAPIHFGHLLKMKDGIDRKNHRRCNENDGGKNQAPLLTMLPKHIP